MSKYTHEQEVEIVKDAMMLTAAIKIGEEELSKQKCKKFKAKPTTPVHKQLEVPKVTIKMPPEPKVNYTFTDFLRGEILYIVISLLVWPFILYAFVKYCEKKRAMLNELMQRDDYQSAVKNAKESALAEQQKINEEVAKQQADIDKKYESDLEQYNNVIIPSYNQEYESWKIAKKIKIEKLDEEVQFNKDTLEALYASTQLISNRYRNFVILQWLYDELSTSDITYERAVDLYNEESLKNTVINASGRVTGAINSMHSSMISGFDALYDAVDEGNEVLAKTRRDQNLANTAGIIQRHNLNKMMKSQNAKLDEHFNK